MKRFVAVLSIVAITATVIGVTAPAHAQCGGSKSANMAMGKKDIVETAVSAGDFKTLVAAVKAAELVEALQSDGPFTVFAPTDAAFNKLPKGTIDALLANPSKLRSILKYHVVPGRVMAADVVKIKQANDLLGRTLKVDASKGVKINSSTVIATDIECRNGIIHVIDSVLIPQPDIIDVAGDAGSFKTLLAAVEAAGLTDTLRGNGPFTVFAPTDAAFAELPDGTVEALLKDIPRLQAILTYHVVPGKVTASDVIKLREAKTVQGQKLRIDTSNGVKVDNAQVVKTDVMAGNGVIHVIDSVMIPPKRTASRGH
jgi:uncharacterized surface protein with fasciclin (FAS1) repeats